MGRQKNTKYILLIIGILGLAASLYGMTTDSEFLHHLPGLVCGTSLIYGYFELKRATPE